MLLTGITAEAREFYGIHFKAKLYYTDLSGTKKMGQTSGSLTGGDDGAFTRLSFEGKTYDITLEMANRENPWINRNGRPDLSFTLPYEPLRALLHDSNGSFWRSAALENHVSELIDRYLTAEKATAGRSVSASYFERVYGNDLDQTVTRLQFHDDQAPESLHLVIDFDNQLEKL